MPEPIQLVYEKLLAASQAPAEPVIPTGDPETFLTVVVIFTTAAATMAAMRHAGRLASELNARLSLLAPQVVPYPMPLSAPPVAVGFSERRLRSMVAECGMPAMVRLFLCRDIHDALAGMLGPRSLVVLGGASRWWPNAARRLGRWLRRRGHEVVFVESE